MSLIVRPAISHHEQAQGARALGAAFVDDPVFARFVPARNRAARIATVFDALMRTSSPSSTRMDIAVRDGSVVGAAIWESPSHSSRPSQLLANLVQVPRVIRAVGPMGVASFLTSGGNFAEHRPVVPHWYLADIGVAPSGQGAGVGRTLLEHGLEAVDSDDSLAYLEATTEGSRRLYERSGFEVRARIAGVGATAPFAMVRPARPSAHTGLIEQDAAR